MSLWLATVIATFGRRAFWRLGILLIGASGVGLLGARVVEELPFVAKLPTIPLLMSTSFLTQIIILFSLIACAGTLKKHDVFIQLLATLPTTQHQRWVAYLLPSGVVGCLSLACIAPPSLVFLQMMDAPAMASLLCIVVGMVSALGLFFALPNQRRYLHLLLGGCVLYAELALIQFVYKTVDEPSLYLLAIGAFWLLQILLIFCLLFSRRYGSSPRRPQLKQRLLSSYLPSRLWYAKKISRAATTRTNLLVAFCISGGLAYLKTIQAVNDPALFSFVLAILVATISADFRGTTRKYQPPEIIALKGTFYFVTQQALTALLLASIATIPLIFSLAWGTDYLEICSLTTKIMLSSGLGLYCGTFLAPSQRDIAGQFLTSLLCILLIFAVPALPFVAPLQVTERPFGELGFYIFILAATYYCEIKRNKYTWKG